MRIDYGKLWVQRGGPTYEEAKLRIVGPCVREPHLAIAMPASPGVRARSARRRTAIGTAKTFDNGTSLRT